MKKAKRGSVGGGRGKSRARKQNSALSVTRTRYVLYPLGMVRLDARQKGGVPHWYAELKH